MIGAYANEYIIASGDLNCDGFSDIVLRDPRNMGGNQYNGYIVFGNKDGFPTFSIRDTGPQSKLYIALRNLLPRSQDGFYFDQIQVIPDINGDKCDDLLIGSAYGTYIGTKAMAYVLFGSKDLSQIEILDLSKMTQSQGFSINELNPVPPNQARLFYKISNLGDFNQDGFNDFAITRPDTGNGYIIWGRDGQKDPFTNMKLSDTTKDWLKIAGEYDMISGIGDINNDGIPDIAINIPYKHSQSNVNVGVYVMYGKKGGLSSFKLEDAKPPFRFKIAGSALIREIAPVGDINGDGYNDFSVFSYCQVNQAPPCKTTLNIIFGRKDPVNLDLSNLSGLSDRLCK